MRDSLPHSVHVNECAIINLDSISGPGTHWVCYKKLGSLVEYFDSFGNLRPPIELIKYWGDVRVCSVTPGGWSTTFQIARLDVDLAQPYSRKYRAASDLEAAGEKTGVGRGEKRSGTAMLVCAGLLKM